MIIRTIKIWNHERYLPYEVNLIDAVVTMNCLIPLRICDVQRKISWKFNLYVILMMTLVKRFNHTFETKFSLRHIILQHPPIRTFAASKIVCRGALSALSIAWVVIWSSIIKIYPHKHLRPNYIATYFIAVIFVITQTVSMFRGKRVKLSLKVINH